MTGASMMKFMKTASSGTHPKDPYATSLNDIFRGACAMAGLFEELEFVPIEHLVFG